MTYQSTDRSEELKTWCLSVRYQLKVETVLHPRRNAEAVSCISSDVVEKGQTYPEIPLCGCTAHENIETFEDQYKKISVN